MKKSIIAVGVVLALGAGWTIAEWQTGKAIEQNKEAYTEKANEQIAFLLNSLASRDEKLNHMIPKLTLTLESFERGILSSKARYSLSETNSKNKDEKVYFLANVEHGPFPVSELASFNLMPKGSVINVEMENTPLTKPTFDITNGKSPFTLKIIPSVGLSYGELTLAPINYEGLQLDDAKFQVTVDRDLSVIKSTGKIGTFNFEAPEGVLKIDSVSMDVDMKQSQFINYKGHQNFKIKNFAFQAKETPKSQFTSLIVLENTTLKNEIKEDDTNVQYSQQMEIGAIKLGPNDLGNVKVGFNVTNINGIALKNFVEAFTKYGAEFENHSDLSKQLIIEQMDNLLASGPVATFAPVSWSNKGGVSSYSATLELNKMSMAELVDLPEEQIPGKIIKNFDSDLSISIPMMRVLVVNAIEGMGIASASEAEQRFDQSTNQLPFLLMSVDKKGVLKLNNDKIESKLNFSNNIITLNGKEMSLAEFLASFDK